MRRTWLRVLFAVLLLSGCERTSTRRDLLGDVDGPVSVKVVETKETGPDLFGPPDRDKPLVRTKRSYELRLGTEPETPVHLNFCTLGRVDVSVSPERDRVAYRCVPPGTKRESVARWTVVYLDREPSGAVTRNHHYWYEGAGPDDGMVVGGKIAWSKVPGFVEAAPKLLMSEPRWSSAKSIFDDVERRAGPGAVEALLPEVASMSPTIGTYSRPDERDEWIVRWERASAEGRKRALEALRMAIRKAKASEGAILRAALLLDALGLDQTPEVLGQRLLEMEAVRMERKTETSYVQRRALAALALRAPEHAVPLACRRLEAKVKLHDDLHEAYAIVALARRGCGGAPKIEPLPTWECKVVLQKCAGDAQASCTRRALEERLREHYTDRRGRWVPIELAHLAAVRADQGIVDDDLAAVGCTSSGP